ncbi:MAG: Transcriptional regulatory protein LiaR [Accumulibacter sp.]|uniref:response regulator transcription factor n=1 Tax=Accumulibacter sp. TaxID=2053492 RepID=UPI00122B813E|nr:LuxR C-terminal-related transcriptional regulator [Accumulibacter sp.]TLD45803.1 MAG: Transcriptional regulatory protein LiaR [Accumulibacter sp.]
MRCGWYSSRGVPAAPEPLTPLHRPVTANAGQTGVGPITPVELGLTPRQADVLYLVLQGKPIKLICRELNPGEGTIKGHVSAVLRALDVTTRTQAIVAAHRLGLLFDAPAAAAPIKQDANSR